MSTSSASGRKRSVQLGERTFITKKAMADVFRDMLSGYKPRQVVSPEHAKLLVQLLEHHPDAASKLGCGISGFEVRSHDLRAGRAVSNANSAKAFWLRRTDGTATDFSFLKCVDEAFAADPDTVHAARVYRALRMAVDDQVLAFRAANTLPGGFVRCALTGALVASVNSHVDHAAPTTLKWLVEQWLVGEGLGGLHEVQTTCRDGTYGTVVADEALLRRWTQFHAEHARLRMLEASVHLRISALERRL